MPESQQIVRDFLHLNEHLEIDPAAYEAVLHPDVEQIEFPNFLNKVLQRRSFQEILENIRAGRELLLNPIFELQSIQSCPNGVVVVEAHWEATLANDIGPLIRGQQLSAQFCMVFEFQDGRIIQQRTYNCFEPF